MPKNMIDDRFIDDITKYWGITAQVDVAIEECAELIMELANLRCHSNIVCHADDIKKMIKHERAANHVNGIQLGKEQENATLERLAEEIADVHLMIEQLLHMFEIDLLFEQKRDQKIRRLRGRMTDDDNFVILATPFEKLAGITPDWAKEMRLRHTTRIHDINGKPYVDYDAWSKAIDEITDLLKEKHGK